VSRRVKLVAGGVLALTAVAVVVDRQKPRFGELLIQSEANSARVTIKEGGKAVVESTDRRSFTLRPGEYDIEPDGPGPLLFAEPPHVSITRGGRAVVRILRVAGPMRRGRAPAVPAPVDPGAPASQPVEVRP
jgi:hypothetical protein